MVKLKDILQKVKPDLKFGESIMNIELGDVDFDTITENYEYSNYTITNSKNPNIKIRIRDDFPFRLVLMKRSGNIINGTTWAGPNAKHTWTKDDPKFF